MQFKKHSFWLQNRFLVLMISDSSTSLSGDPYQKGGKSEGSKKIRKEYFFYKLEVKGIFHSLFERYSSENIFTVR